MENSILVLVLHYHVPEYPNQRWPPDAILKIQHFDYLSQYVVQYVFIGIFKYREFISDIIFVS